ncbi:surfeit locus protein 1 [Athalia rosae]|uniref:surfeit locus protein 1 n=1 Tax=Athalia rosae TaxID=37344 RepID=UPI00203388DB|nr:surfeit locus protein 1 [Athalia rosae]
MNLAVSRIGLKLTNVSTVRNFSHCLKGRLFILSPVNNTEIIVRKQSRKHNHNLLIDSRKHWFVPKKETIGVYGWFLLSLPLFAFGLGCWQVERRKWKLDLISKIKGRLNNPPVDLPSDLEDLQEMEYQPIKVKGRFIHDKEFIIGPRSLLKDGEAASAGGGIFAIGDVQAGYIAVTPFKLEGRPETILINRGWVPMKKRFPEKRPNDIVDGVVEIVGIVRLNEPRPQFSPKNNPMSGGWHYRDLNAMADWAKTEPVYLDLITDLKTEDGPIPGQTRVTMRNEHLSYMLTWFSLSSITGWMWYRMFIRKLPLL